MIGDRRSGKFDLRDQALMVAIDQRTYARLRWSAGIEAGIGIVQIVIEKDTVKFEIIGVQDRFDIVRIGLHIWRRLAVGGKEGEGNPFGAALAGKRNRTGTCRLQIAFDRDAG
jgi:hypothetical protein